MSWTGGTVINTTERMRRLATSIPTAYTVYYDTSISEYRAEACLPGYADYHNASAATTIKNALESGLTGARTWKERVALKGNITLDLLTDTTLSIGIKVPSYTILDCSQAKLSVPNTANTTAGKDNYVIRVPDTCQDVELVGGEIYGNMAGQVAANEIYGIQVGNSHDVMVRDWYIHDTKETAVAFEGISYRCWAVNNKVINTDEDGLGNQHECYDIWYINNYSDIGAGGQAGCVYVGGGVNINVIGNVCRGETDKSPNGIKIDRGIATAPLSVNVLGNSITNCTYGINTADFMTNLAIQGNIVFSCDGDGIVLQDSNTRNCSIMNNTCYNNGQVGGFLSGIMLTDVQNCKIEGNLCYDNQVAKTQHYGINENGTADSNTYRNNTCRGNDVSPYVFVGANNIYDGRIQSEQVQINGGTTISLMPFLTNAYLARAKLHYSTAIANDTNVTVGYARDGAADADYYVTSVTSGTGNQWKVVPLTLLQNAIAAGDTLTFTQDGSGGAGEYLRLVIDYCMEA